MKASWTTQRPSLCLTDQGTQMLGQQFTTDGNVLNAALEHFTIGLRQIRRDAGIWGANDRVRISLTAVQQLAAFGARLPGRKVVLWVSPGWPLLSGPRIDLDGKQQQQIFGNVVTFSRELQQADMTLYNVNTTRAGGEPDPPGLLPGVCGRCQQAVTDGSRGPESAGAGDSERRTFVQRHERCCRQSKESASRIQTPGTRSPLRRALRTKPMSITVCRSPWTSRG